MKHSASYTHKSTLSVSDHGRRGDNRLSFSDSVVPYPVLASSRHFGSIEADTLIIFGFIDLLSIFVWADLYLESMNVVQTLEYTTGQNKAQTFFSKMPVFKDDFGQISENFYIEQEQMIRAALYEIIKLQTSFFPV